MNWHHASVSHLDFILLFYDEGGEGLERDLGRVINIVFAPCLTDGANDHDEDDDGEVGGKIVKRFRAQLFGLDTKLMKCTKKTWRLWSKASWGDKNDDHDDDDEWVTGMDHGGNDFDHELLRKNRCWVLAFLLQQINGQGSQK